MSKGTGMAFIKMPGVKGLVYVPEEKPGSEKKHNCPDCFSCQRCSDVRCSACRKEDPQCGKENTKKN